MPRGFGTTSGMVEPRSSFQMKDQSGRKCFRLVTSSISFCWNGKGGMWENGCNRWIGSVVCVFPYKVLAV